MDPGFESTAYLVFWGRGAFPRLARLAHAGTPLEARASPHAAASRLLPPQALLKLDCQGLVVRLIQDFVLLTTAVEVAQRWRELAEKLARVSKQQMDAYESPHRDRNGVVDSEVSGAASPGLGSAVAAASALERS